MAEKIAIIGGTGKEGKGLAFRWAKSGHQVVIGSRQVEKAQLAADEINQLLDKPLVTGLENAQAADWCDVIVMTVPFSAHVSMLEYLKDLVKGKIFIDVTVPLVPPKVSVAQMPPSGSAGQEAQIILGEETPVVTAFQNISYERLLKDGDIDCDVLVCGANREVRGKVIQLVKDAGMKGWDAGPIENSMVVEGLTSILININKVYGSKESGILITGPLQD
jgi:8-hydroxy-5-deazaflavin:NADPH oxidoreductase